MRPVPFLSTRPPISIVAEPLGNAASAEATSVEGLELVPSWQARPARRVRRLWAAMPVAAIVAAALSLARDHDAAAVRERPDPVMAPSSTASPALVVTAAPVTAAE